MGVTIRKNSPKITLAKVKKALKIRDNIRTLNRKHSPLRASLKIR